MKKFALPVIAALALSACNSAETDATATDTAAADTTMTEPMATEPMTDAAMAPSGDGCAAVPADGEGSFGGMADDPAATAASNNPVLSTLVGAVTQAGLVDTLNSAPELTVFAPVNDAFAALPKATMDAAMADPKGLLTKVLTNHVVAGKIAPDKIAGDHKTLGGGTITVAGSGEDFTVGEAKVICGNVQTANATVYIIDGVLLPAM